MIETWPPPVPSIPPEILQAAKECNLVIFVGAGVSQLMGCPLWPELADAALVDLAKKGFISFGDIRQFTSLDARKRLTIASQIAESAGGRLEIEKLLQPKKGNESKVYDYLNGIGCAYVTTNTDPFLDIPRPKAKAATGNAATDPPEIQPTKPICWPSQFKANLLRERGAVIHLHGSGAEPKSMIYTEAQYLEHYVDSRVTGFLKDMFENHTVLFVGYGLGETEILEHILRKGGRNGAHMCRRFWLQGFYSDQQRVFGHLHNHYRNTFGVEIIPYDLDGKEYLQLEKILEDWGGRLEIGSPLLADDLNYVLGAADE